MKPWFSRAILLLYSYNKKTTAIWRRRDYVFAIQGGPKMWVIYLFLFRIVGIA